MESLLRIGASNALAACALALLAAAAGRFCRRPAVVHSLWLIVLLKLVTPPVLPIRLLPSFQASPAAPVSLTVAADPGATSPPAQADPSRDDDLADPIVEEEAGPAPVSPAPESPEVSDLSPAPAAPASAVAPFPWAGALLLLWAVGSAAWFVLAGLRAYRFARLLRFAEAAPPWLQARAEELAARLGLARCPAVRLVPGHLSPMLWALGGPPRVFLPAGLLGRLDPAQQDALLAHELAHLRRRDHWVRGLEMLVTVLYWWHPVAWWARRELREAEEQCCDAWVLWALPGAHKTYALALVETVDFLSQARSPLPQGASGIGQVQHLRRRITMIMRGTTPRALTWAGGLAVFALGAVLLPLLPTWERTQAADPITKEEKEDLKLANGAKAQEGADKTRADLDALKAHAQLELYRAQMQQAQAQYQAAIANLKAAEAALAEAKKKADAAQAQPPSAKPRKVTIIIEGEDGKVQRIEVPSDRVSVLGTFGYRPAYVARTDGTITYPPAGVVVGQHAPPVKQEYEKRLADLEQELKQVRHELDALKRQGQQHQLMPYLPPQPQRGNFFQPAAPTAPLTAPAAEATPAPVAPENRTPAARTTTAPPATPAKP